jgi:Ca2+-binding RTX toxin-like protein
MGIWTPGPGPSADDDVFIGDGTNETADGGAGNDTLSGGDGDDVLHGGIGNDTLTLDIAGDTDALFGDDGDDLIIVDDRDLASLISAHGGSGHDTLWLKNAILAPGSSFSGFETLFIDDNVFGDFPPGIFDGVTTLLLETGFTLASPGVLDFSAVYIPDSFVFNGVQHSTPVINMRGSSGDDTIILPVDPTTNSLAFLMGYDGNDTLSGTENNDELRGGNGDDILSGGDGEDILISGASGSNGDILNGGAGNDLLQLDGEAKVTLDGGDGDDLLALSGVLLPGSAIQNVETILIENAGVDPNALAGIQTILFARYQAFLSLSQAGVLDLRSINMPGTYDITVAGTRFYHDDPVLTFTGTDGDDTLLLDADAAVRLFSARGGDGNDHLMGGGKDDQLLAGDGNNILEGQDGNDTLRHSTNGHDFSFGGNGDDTFEIDGGFGSYTFDGGDGSDTLMLRTNHSGGVSGINSGTTFTSIETIIIPSLGGGAVYFGPGAMPTSGTFLSANQVIALSAPGTLNLSGLTTPSTFVYKFQTYDNIFRFRGSNGDDTLIAPLSIRTGDAHGGKGSDTLYGGNLDDNLMGEEGADFLFGGNGADALQGDNVEDGAGDDVLDGGAGNDYLVGRYGNDLLIGQAGVDTAGYSFNSMLASWHRNPDGTWTINATADGAGTDTLNRVEFLDFTDRDVFLDRAYSTFSGDGASDILMQHSSGAMGVWFVGASGVTGAAGLGALDSTWDIEGVGDFNGDSKDDILLWNDNGFLGMWFMNGATIAGAGGPGAIDKTSWDIEGIGDFNGDGKDDILLWNDNGSLGLWFMNAATATGAALGGLSKATWDVEGLGDLNGDGKDDIVWRNTSGDMGVWFMNGASASGAGLGNVGLDWAIEGLGDFNGDGRDDILMRHDSGSLGVWFMNGATATGAGLGNVSQDLAVAAIGDYNGDGKDDILWWDANGNLGAWFMNGASATGLGYGAVSHDWVIDPS